MKFLSMPTLFRFFAKDMKPSSLAYRHRMASAVPTERSLPVGQQINILFVVVGDGRDAMKFGRRASSFRKSREPNLLV